MKEQILNTFETLGFQLEEMEGFGYGFQYEGINYLYIPCEDDEEFLDIAIPAIMEINEDNLNAALMLMDRINSTVKYVKANNSGDSIWLSYERELLCDEDLEMLVSRMILHLEAAMNFYRKTMASIKNELEKEDEENPTDDTEEAA